MNLYRVIVCMLVNKPKQFTDRNQHNEQIIYIYVYCKYSKFNLSINDLSTIAHHIFQVILRWENELCSFNATDDVESFFGFWIATQSAITHFGFIHTNQLNPI